MFGLSYLKSQEEVSEEKGKKEKILANCLFIIRIVLIISLKM